ASEALVVIPSEAEGSFPLVIPSERSARCHPERSRGISLVFKEKAKGVLLVGVWYNRIVSCHSRVRMSFPRKRESSLISSVCGGFVSMSMSMSDP
ncbi:MAG: hypothetical protein WBB66_01590, partial [Candidatus Omnitrophota bacterium]